MTNEERDIITRFIERVAGAGGSGGSVPATSAPLPAIDPEADGLIGDLLARHPEARYRLAQMAFVQEHALAAAQSRITDLQSQLAAARSAQGPASAPAAAPARGGFFSGLFGAGAASSAPPPPPPQQAYAPPPPPYAAPPQQPSYAPPGGYQPGMFQRGGSGFLGSALTTAAGVAGGVVAANALMSLFSPHTAFGGGFGGGVPFGGGTPENVTIINENGNPGASPWADPNQGNFDPNQAGFDPNQGNFDPGQAGFDPNQGGFDPSQAGFDPTQADFDPNQGGFDPGGFDNDDTQV
ncbi:MAG TPA: DUF2076 domain-containing protein [Acetobacteraceae bacterium]|nr:DUF2076 domain-containing protein [Acetobacteraceae bacterium]